MTEWTEPPENIFAMFTEGLSLPVTNTAQPWPKVNERHGLDRTLDGLVGALHRGRRVAYLDSTFPWQRSGFRYHEALALHELQPDAMFFSMWELSDPFPAPVHPLADFPRLARRNGITDIYAVFSLFLEGMVGMRPWGSVEAHPMESIDLSKFLAESGIRVHGTIFPGGGFTPTEYGLRQAQELARRIDTTFSYVPEVLENIEGATYVQQALTEVRFYEQTEERWEKPTPLVCLFAADASTRKGLDVALGAFLGLDPALFHLHVVGPHEHRRSEWPAELVTFHGWLLPEQLRDLHKQVHVFLSPVSVEPTGPDGSFLGVTDGFPTQAAADAISSGALLLSANPAGDHRVMKPGEHYIELPAEVEAFREALYELSADPERTRRLAKAGSDQLREQADVRRGVGEKLELMGFGPAGTRK
jgi:hypothetical protein